MTTTSITSSGITFQGGVVSPNHLTPDEMLVYLQTRLTNLDDQLSAIMDKQKKSEAVRKALQACQNETANLGDEGGKVNVAPYADALNDIAQSAGTENAAKVLEQYPDEVRKAITWDEKKGEYVVAKGKDTVEVSKDQAAAFKTWNSNAIKDVESGAELEMIKLQSLMSARNTAISLATNIMSAMGKGTETITGNIGR